MKQTKKPILIIAAFLVILALSLQASALFEDFSASSSQTVYAGECSSSASRIAVKNTGAITSSYSVHLEGKAAAWATYAPSEFSLKPLESKDLFVYISAPCNAEGKYPLQTYIKTALGLEKALEQDIIITESKNIEITPKVYSSKIKPCGTASYKFELRNTGAFTETYEISASGDFADKTTFSQSIITLESGKSASFEMHVIPPCSKWGDYSLSFNTKAKLSGASSKTEGISLEIEKDYSFSMTFGKILPLSSMSLNSTSDEFEAYDGSYRFCEHESGYIPVLVENNAAFANTFYFGLKGEEWASLSGTSAEIPGNGAAYLNIIISPSMIANLDSQITVSARTDLGDARASAEKQVSLGICHIPEIAQSISRIKTYYNASFTEIPITNTGSEQTEYRLEAEGAAWISITPESIELQPGEEGKAYLYLQPTNETVEGSYAIAVKAYPECSRPACSTAYAKQIEVSIKEPRLSNMIFDEYLPFTIIFFVLLAVIAVLMVLFAMHLEKTKDKRARAAEKRSIARQKAREAKEKARQKRMLERQKHIAARNAEKEKRRLARQKEKEKARAELEKKKLQKKAAKEKKNAEKAKLKAEKARIKAENAKAREKLAAERAKAKEEKRKALEQKSKEKEQKAQARKSAEKRAPSAPFKDSKLMKWLKLAILILIILAAAALLSAAVYYIIIFAAAVLQYKNYIIWGAIIAAIIIILLILIESAMHRFYRQASWKSIMPGQKKVLFVKWKKGLGEVIFQLKKPVQNARVSARKSFGHPVFLQAGGKVYQYFGVNKSFDNKDIEKVSFRFRVDKKWLARNNIPSDSVKLMRYNNESWTAADTRMISQASALGKYNYYEASLSSCSIFAITGKPEPKKQEKEEPKKKEKEELKKQEELRKQEKEELRKQEKEEKKAEAKKVAEKKKQQEKPKAPKKKKKTSLKWLWYTLIALILLVLLGIGIYYLAVNFDFSIFGSQAEEALNATSSLSNETIITAANATLAPSLKDTIEPEANATVVPAVNVTIEPELNDTLIPIPNATANISSEPEHANETDVEDAESEWGIPTQEWNEDKSHELDLSAYFYDPDDDRLFFTYTTLEHIQVSVDEEGIATFTPEKDWHGEEKVAFTAEDGKGGLASSNEFTLRVLESSEEPLMDRLKSSFAMYSNFVIVGIILLVLIILLIEFRKPILKFLEED